VININFFKIKNNINNYYNMATFFMPLILDLSNNESALLFGEKYDDTDISGEPFDYHLKWNIETGVTINDVSGILYGDRDASGSEIFYQTTGGVDAFANAVGDALKAASLFQTVSCGTALGNAIPLIGNTVTHPGSAVANAFTGFLATENSKVTVGEALLRVMSTHLLGHPLAQTIIKNDTNFLAGADTATDNMVIQFKKDMGGTGADVSLNTVAMAGDSSNNTGGVDASGLPVNGTSPVVKTDGKANAIFKSILEQMLAGGNDLKSRFENAPTDVSDNGVNTYVHRLPLRVDDTIVLYIRARAQMSMESGDSVIDSSGAAPNNQRGASAIDISAIFPGGETSSTYGWIGRAANTGALTQHNTDETDPKVFDGHIWRVSIKITAA